MIKNILKHYYNGVRTDFKYIKYYKRSTKYYDTIAADVIRYTHSIEKGLSLEKVRLGFGHEKQKLLMELIVLLENSKTNYHKEVVKMGVSVIEAYLDYHKEKNYSDDFISILNDFVLTHKEYIDNSYAGVKELKKSEMNFNINDIEKFFNTRHSIRDFSDKPVNKDTLLKAIKLAQTAPSACNRQGVRVHILDKSNASDFNEWLAGVGGFVNDIDKILIITAKTSSYRFNENFQYIVSSSIFAGYLSLTLHLYGLGACVVQRPVIWTKNWHKFQKKYDISKDEQIICIFGVGQLKDKVMVPISHRISLDEFSNFIK